LLRTERKSNFLQLNNTLLIEITFPFNGEIHVVSHVCLISQVRSPIDEGHVSDTPPWHLRVRIAQQQKSGVLNRKLT